MTGLHEHEHKEFSSGIFFLLVIGRVLPAGCVVLEPGAMTMVSCADRTRVTIA